MLAQLAWRGEQTTSTSPSMADRSILVLSPVFLVMMLGVTFGAAFSEWEDMRPRLMLRVRAIHVVVVMAATCVAAVPIGGLYSEGVTACRNGMFFLGLALLWTVILEPPLNWTLPLVIAGFNYSSGQANGDASPVPAWLFLLRTGDAQFAFLSVATLIGGAVAFVVWGPKRSLAPDLI